MKTNDRAAFLAAWVSLVGSEPVTIAELLTEARKGSPAGNLLALEIQAMQPGRARVSKVGLGKSLVAMLDKPAGGLALQRLHMADAKQWVWSVGPIGVPMPPRTRRDAARKAIRTGVRHAVKIQVAETVAKIERTEQRVERRAAVEIAKQVFAKPQRADFEKPYISTKVAERIARNTPGGRPSLDTAEPRRYTAPDAGGKRKAPRETRTGVCATGIYTQTAKDAHQAAHNFAGLGVPCEVREHAGKFHLFSPCPPSEMEARRVRFSRCGYSTEAGDDAASEDVAPPAYVYESVSPWGRRGGGGGSNWSVFD